MDVSWKKFNALGTEIILSAYLELQELCLLESAQRIILDFEKRFSRFLKNNELDNITKSAGQEFSPSPMLMDIIVKAKRLHEETDGMFDPTVVEILEAVGYDKNFAQAAKDSNANHEIDWEKINQKFQERPRFNDLKILNDEKIFVPLGLRLDLGGIGKGYIADFLASYIFGEIKNFWISAGGDILIKGNNGEKNGWRVAVQDPIDESKEIFSIDTKGKKLGIATSGIQKRNAKTGSSAWHHLINPKTGRPANNNVIAVTTISTSATKADVFCKAVLLMGEKQGLEFIEGTGDSFCIIFLRDGSPVFSKGALNYL